MEIWNSFLCIGMDFLLLVVLNLPPFRILSFHRLKKCLLESYIRFQAVFGRHSKLWPLLVPSEGSWLLIGTPSIFWPFFVPTGDLFCTQNVSSPFSLWTPLFGYICIQQINIEDSFVRKWLPVMDNDFTFYSVLNYYKPFAKERDSKLSKQGTNRPFISVVLKSRNDWELWMDRITKNIKWHRLRKCIHGTLHCLQHNRRRKCFYFENICMDLIQQTKMFISAIYLFLG